MVLQALVARLLNKALGWLVRDLNPEDLRVAVWGGDIVLENLQLRPEALAFLKLPIRVKAGYLGRLRVKVPWSNLKSEPVVVEIDRIYAVAALDDEPDDEEEGVATVGTAEERERARSLASKRAQLARIDAEAAKASKELGAAIGSGGGGGGRGGGGESWAQSFAAKLTQRILDNLQLTVNQVHVRVECVDQQPRLAINCRELRQFISWKC